MNDKVLEAALLAIATPLVFALFSKLYPANESVPTELSLEELGRKYRKQELMIGLGFIALSAAFAFVIWVPLRAASNLYTSLLPAAEVTFSPMPAYWALPAMFLGALCAGPLTTALAKRLMREPRSYPEYQAYQTLRYKFDVNKVNRVVGGFVVVSCAAVIFLGLDSYVQLDGNTLVVNGYLSTGPTRYGVGEIAKIQTAPQFTAPNGNLIKRQEFVVTFKNGDKWSTEFIPSNASLAKKRWFVELLSARSKVPIEEVHTLGSGEIY